MSEDVRSLMRRAGVSTEGYRELVLEQGARQASRLWPLIAAVDRRLLAAAAGADAGGGADEGKR